MGVSKRAAALAAFYLASLAAPLFASRVEIKEGRFYVDGEPFYVRAVGYAPWRPHQHPGISYADTNWNWTKLDFERIKAAHFNTIRTWDALDPDVLNLAKENGLMVLQGIWLDPKQDFSDPHNQQAAVAQVRAVAEKSKDADNILGYLVMTEPSPQAVLETGVDNTNEFFRRLKRAIQEVDPRPVSMDSWAPLAFMDQREFDFATFNLFAFWPKSLNHAMGLAGLTRWFADHFAQDRPLIVGETGGYSVSEASSTAAGGYGGLTEYDQSLKDLESLRQTLEGHAWGSALVSWIDTWHYPRDPDTHDNEPWEWDGILGIPTDSKKDMEGIPRQVYHDVALYNDVIPWRPKANHYYPVLQSLPIDAFGSDEVVDMQYSVNGSDWKTLEASGHGYFHGFFMLPELAKKRQTMTFQALDKDGTVLATKRISFLASMEPERVKIEPATGQKGLSFQITALDGNFDPIPQRKVYYGCFDPVHFGESQGTLTTNDHGTVNFSCADAHPSAYLYVAAGTDSPDRVRASDLRIFKVNP